MKSFMVSAYTILLLGFATVAQTAETDAVCPVSGKKAAKVSMSHNGGEVYFCCKNCRKAFKKDASKFSAKANEQLIKTGQASQQKCPISGGKMKSGTELDVDGVSVAFCCKNCRKKVDQASGDEKLAMVFGDGAKCGQEKWAEVAATACFPPRWMGSGGLTLGLAVGDNRAMEMRAVARIPSWPLR